MLTYIIYWMAVLHRIAHVVDVISRIIVIENVFLSLTYIAFSQTEKLRTHSADNRKKVLSNTKKIR